MIIQNFLSDLNKNNNGEINIESEKIVPILLINDYKTNKKSSFAYTILENRIDMFQSQEAINDLEINWEVIDFAIENPDIIDFQILLKNFTDTINQNSIYDNIKTIDDLLNDLDLLSSIFLYPIIWNAFANSSNFLNKIFEKTETRELIFNTPKLIEAFLNYPNTLEFLYSNEKALQCIYNEKIGTKIMNSSQVGVIRLEAYPNSLFTIDINNPNTDFNYTIKIKTSSIAPLVSGYNLLQEYNLLLPVGSHRVNLNTEGVSKASYLTINNTQIFNFNYLIEIARYTANGEYITPNVDSLYFSGCGGGGGGAGTRAMYSSSNWSMNSPGGGGGGSGYYIYKQKYNVNPNSIINITIGTGGAGGAASTANNSANAGKVGGSTIIGTLVTLAGGNGGGAPGVTTSGVGGTGGTGSASGGNGGTGTESTAGIAATAGTAGNKILNTECGKVGAAGAVTSTYQGGGGGGAAGLFIGSNGGKGGSNAAGGAGAGYGSGGGGAGGNSKAGGKGASGIVVIYIGDSSNG